jgi:UDP-N-acetylglucosamine--N-acetylmuramyl-(pentapeptide) pyrophosphoryl-undecaprenol N-acetylglucosamine transferase
MQKNNLKILISGGGTGGHIFPAISIANALKSKYPGTEILFVGAEGRMEMEKVPAAGYKIIGLPVMGLSRKLSPDLIKFVFKTLKSYFKARKIVKQFKPDVAVGVGGYASGPALRAASSLGVQCIIQEQNSYPGITNKLLAKKVKKICVAYDNMEKYFPANKIIKTGNPIRQEIENLNADKIEARNFFGLEHNIPVILVVGGSLGAKTINESIQSGLIKIYEKNIGLIWQTGKTYFETAKKSNPNNLKNILITDFIFKMDYAFAAADIIISRAGAGTISELCVVGKPVILVPSPNVAEDHQTKNAMALVEKNAAILVKDKDAVEKLVNVAIELVENQELKNTLSENIKKLAVRNSAEIIADEIYFLVYGK